MARRRWNHETIKQIVDGESPFVQFGYLPKPKKRKFGDQWKDKNGITWEQCNGYKKRVNEKADCIRNMIKRFCSKCGKDLDFSKNKLDDKIFPKTGKCYDCIEADESIMRVTGEYKEYEKKKILQNKLSYLRDFKQKLLDSIKYLKNDDSKLSLVMASGELMTWTGSQNSQLLKTTEDDLISVDELIAAVEKMVDKLK